MLDRVEHSAVDHQRLWRKADARDPCLAHQPGHERVAPPAAFHREINEQERGVGVVAALQGAGDRVSDMFGAG